MKNANRIGNLLSEMSHILKELGNSVEEELRDHEDMICILSTRINCLEEQLDKQKQKNREIVRILMED